MTPSETLTKHVQRSACIIIAAVFLLYSVKGLFHGVYKDGMHLVTAYMYGWLAYKAPFESRAGILFLAMMALVSIWMLLATWSSH